MSPPDHSGLDRQPLDGALPPAGPGDPARPPRRAFLRGAAGVLLGAGGFVAGAEVVDRAVPAHIPVLTAKLEHLRTPEAQAYTTIFVGTSRTYRQIVPAVVDRIVAEKGHAERTFNLGAPRLVNAEAEWMLEAILARPPRALRRVVIETLLYDDAAANTYGTSRHVAWHSTGATTRFLRHALAGAEDRDAVLERLKTDGSAWGKHVTAVGRLAERFRLAWDPSFDDDEEDDSGVEDAGFRPLEREKAAGVRKRRARFKKQHAGLRAETRRRVLHPGRRRELDAYRELVLERIVHLVRGAGLEPMLFEPPEVKPKVRFRSEVLRALPVLDVNDPAAYPELYEPELHFDWGHLSGDGAAAMSAHVGELLARHLAGEPLRVEPSTTGPVDDPQVDAAGDAGDDADDGE